MKRIPYFRLALVALGLLVISTSCQTDETSPATQLDESNEVIQETDLTGTLEDVDEMVLLGFQRNGISDRVSVTLTDDICDRTNISWLPAEKKMILDFGEGCTSPRGVLRKGKIIVTYTGRYWVPGSKITTTFENYSVDGKMIEGIREVTNEGFNLENNFFTFSASLKNGKMTWEDGSSKTFESRHTKRIYLPNGERGLYYAVSGGSKGLNRNGKSYFAETSEPLIFSERCIKTGVNLPNRGVLKIKIETRNLITIDFGTEGCDREVSITVGDKTKTITLPRA